MKKLKKLKVLYKRYEGVLIPLALFFGFATDILTFRLVRFTTSMVFLLGHLFFAAINIVVVNYFKEKTPKKRVISYWVLFAPLFVQFSFGNLFSGFLIFYFESGSFFASWPFFLVLISLLVGNEIARRRDMGPVVQIGAYFFALFAYLNLALPYILKRLTPTIFIISGLTSLILIFIFLYFLSRKVERIKKDVKTLGITVISIFLFINILYFSNLIPPIPLTMRDVGIYHEIQRINDNYLVKTEECQSWDNCFFSSKKRHIDASRARIYFYSAVYAPSGMDMTMVHRWQRKNEETGRWITKAEIPFNLYGGRSVGFRWYSYYTVNPGLWRVTIQTERGQVVGRKRFHIIKEEDSSSLKIDKKI